MFVFCCCFFLHIFTLDRQQIVLSAADYTSSCYTLAKLTNAASNVTQHRVQFRRALPTALQRKPVPARAMSEGNKVREGLALNVNHQPNQYTLQTLLPRQRGATKLWSVHKPKPTFSLC